VTFPDFVFVTFPDFANMFANYHEQGPVEQIIQGSEKEEREEWKERRAGNGRGLNNFTGSSPGNQRPTKKDAEE